MSNSQQTNFERLDFKVERPEDFKPNGFTPAAEGLDKWQQSLINYYLRRIVTLIQQKVTSQDCATLLSRGECLYIEKDELQNIWKELDDTFGKNSERVKIKLFGLVSEVIKREGFQLEPDDSTSDDHFFNSNFDDKSAKYKIVRIGGKTWLDEWLDEEDDQTRLIKTLK